MCFSVSDRLRCERRYGVTIWITTHRLNTLHTALSRKRCEGGADRTAFLSQLPTRSRAPRSPSASPSARRPVHTSAAVHVSAQVETSRG